MSAAGLLLSLLLLGCSGDGAAGSPRSAATPEPGATLAPPGVPAPAAACEGNVVLTEGSTGQAVLFSFTAAGPGQRQTLGYAWAQPSTSPDGKRIAYFRGAPAPGLYVWDLTTASERRLADAILPHYPNRPTWSASGDRIAFESARSTAEGAPTDIFVVGADGTGLLNLTNGRISGTGPTWSADGSRLAFTGVDNARDLALAYTVKVDGTDLRPVGGAAASHSSWSVSWSPDGGLIAFVSARDGNGEVYVVLPDGSGETNLTRSPSGEIASPVGGPPLAWSPDGRRVAFLSDRDGQLNVYTVGSGGGTAVRVSRGPGVATDPRWTADGRCLTYLTSGRQPAGNQLVLAAADGSTTIILSDMR